jgi:hypothetical protein
MDSNSLRVIYILWKMVPCRMLDTTLALVSLRHMILIILLSPIKLAGMSIQSIKTRHYVQPPVQILHDEPFTRACYTSFFIFTI